MSSSRQSEVVNRRPWKHLVTGLSLTAMLLTIFVVAVSYPQNGEFSVTYSLRLQS